MMTERNEDTGLPLIDDGADAEWNRPITPAGASLLVSRWGWRFAGFVDPAVSGSAFAEFAGRYSTQGPRFLAVFLPVPDDGTAAVLADGITHNRALRRGIEAVRRIVGSPKEDLFTYERPGDIFGERRRGD